MADNYIQEGKKINLAVPSGITSGDPLTIGDIHGVATVDRDNSGNAPVAVDGVWDLSVTATSSSGDAAIEVGDPIYIDSDFALSNDATEKFFGNALEAVAAGATATINVRVQQSPSAEGGTGEVVTLDSFRSAPVACAKDGAGAATGTAGDENLLFTGENVFEYHILGTQTIVSPAAAATGLNVGMDQTADDGVELTQGILANAPGVFTVGTSPAFYAKCKFSIPDVSGSDDCAFGFRKLEAYQAAIDNYDEMAALNVISGDIKIETILNGGATTTTDTTDNWADGETHTLEVYVSAAGVVTYKIDGDAPTATAAFTFDDAEVVIPFFYFLHDTDLAGAVTLQSWEVGYQ